MSPLFRSTKSCKNPKYQKNKVLTILVHARNFTFLGTAKIISKTSDMTKVKNKNESITFFRGIYRIMKVFSK